jgi:hypothetical protein
MVGRFFAAMRVKVALPQDIPMASTGRIDAEFIHRARSVMAIIMGASLVDMGPDGFLLFPMKSFICPSVVYFPI